MIYLDFEKPIQELAEELEKLKSVAEKSKVDMSGSIAELEAKILSNSLATCSS
jgi:acetyl-CoA carboxylase carboxyl transferase subunit alpha